MKSIPSVRSECCLLFSTFCWLCLSRKCDFASEMTYIVSSGALNSTHSLEKMFPQKHKLLWPWYPNVTTYLEINIGPVVEVICRSRVRLSRVVIVSEGTKACQSFCCMVKKVKGKIHLYSTAYVHTALVVLSSHRRPTFSLDGSRLSPHTRTLTCSDACCPSLPLSVLHLRTPSKYMDYYSFTDPRGMEGWVGLVGWPIANSLPT